MGFHDFHLIIMARDEEWGKVSDCGLSGSLMSSRNVVQDRSPAKDELGAFLLLTFSPRRKINLLMNN